MPHIPVESRDAGGVWREESALRGAGSLLPGAGSVLLETGSVLLEAIAQMQDGLLVVDDAWRLTYANEQARRISRILPDYLNGKPLWELYPELVGTEAEVAYRRSMELRVEGGVEFFYAPFAVWLKVRIMAVSDGGLVFHYSDVTALRRLEGARDAALAELEQVLETTSDAVVSLDREWRFTFVNRRAAELLGAWDDLLGESLWNKFPNSVYPGSPYVEHYYRAMYEGIAGVFEAYYPAPLNGWLRIEARPAPGGMIAFFRDITRQRADEEALRASEEKYRVLTELGPTAIWMGAKDGRITYANTRYTQYIGMNVGPEDGTAWLNAFCEEDRERVEAVWMHSVRTGEPYGTEARLIRAVDGAVRWWHLKASPLRDEGGAVTMWLGVADEIHESKMAAERLLAEQAETERQRAELEAVYQTAPVGLALFEPKEFRYLRVNHRQAETLGWPAETIVGKRVDEVVGQPEVLRLFERVAAGGTVRDHLYTTEITGRPGEMRTFNVNYSPVRGGDGAVRAISAAILDVTQQSKAEAALRQSEKLAVVGRLASSISHEINNPLEAVTNLLYLTAAEPGLSAMAREWVRLAQDELTRVSQIATQTLRFHRQANSPTRVTAAQMVDPVLALFAGRLLNSGIHVEACYATTRTVLCFENDIRQVLNNLIANAIDAMRTGGRLMVRAHAAVDLRSECEGVRLTVADTGHGMNAATLRRVFEPFYTTKELNGNGLGLWISQGIVERHQGQLRVRSTQHPLGHGTVFSLFLPSAQEPLPSV